MAVSTAYAPLTYSWASTDQVLPVTWPFHSGTLLVTEIASTGIETVKTIATHYTVSGGTITDTSDPNVGLASTGSVTMIGAATSGSSLRIERRTPKTQSSTWTNGGSFQAKTLEAALDKSLLIVQENVADGADDVTGDVLQLNTAGATDYWDGEDHILRNILDGTEDDDAVNKSQLDAAIAGTTSFTQAGTGAVTRTWQEKMRESLSVGDFGAIADYVAVTAATTIVSGSNSLAVNGGHGLSAADIGKSICVKGAGASGHALSTTIAGVPDANTLTLGNNAVTSLTSYLPVDYAGVEQVTLHHGTDNTSAFQAAIDAAYEAGKSTVSIPNGHYFFPAHGAALDPGVGPIAFVGSSRGGSVLHWDGGDKAINSGNEKYLFLNRNSGAKGDLEFLHLTIAGVLADGDTETGGVAIDCWYYNSVTIFDCAIRDVLSMATQCHLLGRLHVSHCQFINTMRDAVRSNDTPLCQVHNNLFWRNGDDPVALHVGSSSLLGGGGTLHFPGSEGFYVNNNIFVLSFAVKCLGSRTVDISHNAFLLTIGASIDLGQGVVGSLSEGERATRDVIISHNHIADSIRVVSGAAAQAQNVINIYLDPPHGAISTNSTAPTRYDTTGSAFIYPWDWQDADSRNSAYAFNPPQRFQIIGNSYKRTLPNAAAVSDFGWGTIIQGGAMHDLAYGDTEQRADGWLRFSGCTPLGLQVFDNTVESVGTAIAFPEPTDDRSVDGVIIARNTFRDVNNFCVSVSGTSSLRLGMLIDDNYFNNDPYRVNAGSNADGTYSTSTLRTINLSNYTGVDIRRNTFENTAVPVQSNVSSSLNICNNRLICGTPSALGFSVSNRGVGTIDAQIDRYTFTFIDADPTSPTYGQYVGQMLNESTAMPSSGWYQRGWFVRDRNVSTSNGRTGWSRLTTGTSHVLNTDWMEVGAVRGPSSATDNALVRFDATTGRMLQDSGVIVDDSNNMTLPGSLTAQSTVALTADISPSQITANQNDYSPTGLSTASVLRLSSDATRNITGLAGGADGRVMVLHNVGSNAIVIIDESASSTAANRFALSSDLTINADHSVAIQYDSTSSRWRAIGAVSTSAVGTAINAASAITTLEDTDRFGVIDASASSALVPITWASLKAEIASEVVSNRAYSEYATNTNLTTQIPLDDTIPQSSEGTEILSASITPLSASSVLRVRFTGQAALSGTGETIAALFRDSGADAIAATVVQNSGAAWESQLHLECEVSAGSTSATTFKVNVGPGSAVTLRMNGSTAARYFGGVSKSTLVVEEIPQF